MNLNRGYQRIFGHAAGGNTNLFLRNVSWSFGSGMIAAIIMYAVNIVGGRMLGPIEYGQYSLVIAISQILVIPMTWGFETSVTYFIASGQKKPLDKSQILSSGLFFILVATFVVALLAYGARNYLATTMHTSQILICAAIVFSALLAWKLFLDGSIRGLELFQVQAGARIMEAAIAGVGLFGALYFLASFSHISFLSVILVSMIALVVLYLGIMRHEFSIRNIRLNAIRILINYGKLALLGALSGLLFTSVDRFIIRSFLGSNYLGIYIAYYTSSMMIIAMGAGLIGNVLFSMASRHEDLYLLIRKLDKIMKISILPLILGTICILYISLRLYGKQYAIEWPLIIMMSISSAGYFFYILYWWLIAGDGLRGIWHTSTHSIIAGFIYIAILYGSILRLQLVAVPVAYCISFIYILYAISLWRKKAMK